MQDNVDQAPGSGTRRASRSKAPTNLADQGHLRSERNPENKSSGLTHWHDHQ